MPFIQSDFDSSFGIDAADSINLDAAISHVDDLDSSFDIELDAVFHGDAS
jgi:hypothetical protein